MLCGLPRAVRLEDVNKLRLIAPPEPIAVDGPLPVGANATRILARWAPSFPPYSLVTSTYVQPPRPGCTSRASPPELRDGTFDSLGRWVRRCVADDRVGCGGDAQH